MKYATTSSVASQWSSTEVKKTSPCLPVLKGTYAKQNNNGVKMLFFIKLKMFKYSKRKPKSSGSFPTDEVLDNDSQRQSGPCRNTALFCRDVI